MQDTDLLSTPLWKMTGREFLELSRSAMFGDTQREPREEREVKVEKHYEYGIAGIARIFNCSIPTANRIKKSGVIDGAIKQLGRKIVVDVEKALELAERRNKRGGRR